MITHTTITQWMHNPAVEMLGWVLLHSLWQLTLVAAAAATALWIMRRATATARYAVAVTAMALMVLLPAATGLWIWRTTDVAPTAPAVNASVAPAVWEAAVPLAGDSTPPAAPLPIRPRAESRTDTMLACAVLAYFAGAILLSLRLLLGLLRIRRLRRGAAPVRLQLHTRLTQLKERLHIRRPVALLESAGVEVPTVIGVLRPLILLPAAALTGLSAEQLEALLAHELAHIRRHDYLVNLAQTLAETLLFYHPAIWWLSARIRQEREHCCDDVVIAAGIGRATYAYALAEMETARGSPQPALAANSGALLPRIRRILQLDPTPRRHPRWVAISSLISVALVLATLAYVVGCNRSQPPSTRASAPLATTPQESGETQDYPPGFDEPADNSEVYKHLIDDYDRQIAGLLRVKPAANDPELMRLHHLRDQAVKMFQGRLRSEQDTAAARAKLEQNIDLDARRQPFDKVLATLHDITTANIYVNWKALHDAGIERDTPITLNMQRAPFRKVLDTLLSEVAPKATLGYTVEDGVITISTREDLNSAKYQVVRVFDIRDLLIQPDTNARPPFGGPAPEKNAHPPITRDQILKEIIDTITSTVAPESWRSNGGKIGAIRELNGQLIINQTIDNQRAIYGLLNQLRETRAVQIGLKSSMYLVDDDTFRKLNLTPLKGNKTYAGTLDDAQLAKLTKVLESSANVATLGMPRVTLFNGQRSYLAMTEQINYVAGCKSKTDKNDKLTPDYDIQTLTSGTVLNIEGTVSTDRRYVVLKTQPQFRYLEKLEKLPAPDMPASPEFFIQKPIVHTSEFTTMCSVASGQTIVLEGSKVAGTFAAGGSRSGAQVEDSRSSKAQGPDRRLLVVIRPTIITQTAIIPEN